VVAHPFASMLLPLGLASGRAQAESLRDAYLAAFADLAPHAELVETLALACRVAKVARSLIWQRAIGASGAGALDDSWARAPVELLAAVLDDSL
jgi:hypothetical protein